MHYREKGDRRESRGTPEGNRAELFSRTEESPQKRETVSTKGGDEGKAADGFWEKKTFIET